MKWRFWKKDPVGGCDQPAITTHPGPIPRWVCLYLVERLELGADWVRSLDWVTRPVAGHPGLHEFRVFSPSQMTILGVEIVDYATLDEHENVILFCGTFDMETGKVNLMSEIKRRLSDTQAPARDCKST